MLEIFFDDRGLEDDLPGDLRLERDDAERIVAAALEHFGDQWRKPEAPLEFGSGRRWTPDLVGPGTVCHVLTTASLSRTWTSRMDAARSDGLDVFVAGPLEAWYSNEVVLGLTPRVSGIVVTLPADGGWEVAGTYRTVPDLVSSERLILEPGLFQELGTLALQRALDAETSYDKGWYYEDFLALLFSQVSFLEVLERNFKNETQELDLVLRDRRVEGGSIALASGKNEAKPVGKNALVHLRAKMADRRGQCELGFLCSARKIARTTHLEDLAYRREGSAVVFIDQAQAEEILAEPAALDDTFRKMIYRAALT